MAKISTNSVKDLLIHIGIIVALVLVLFLAFFFVYLPFTTNHGESVTVPDVQKMDVRQVGSFLAEKDLTYHVSDCTYVIGVPPLSVISQYPKPGAKVKEGRKIYVTVVSQSVPRIKMPKVTDMSHKSAELLLKSNGLVLGEIRYVPDLAHGSVLKQLYNGKEIQPGEEVPKGSKIDLEVGQGLGDSTFPAPQVVGMTEEEATFQILGANLKIGQKMIVPPPSEDTPPGTVTRQNPSAGNAVRVGQEIDIWITDPGSVQEENQF